MAKNFPNKTAERNFDALMKWRHLKPRETRPRDRSLRGKQRRKARKDENKKRADA